VIDSMLWRGLGSIGPVDKICRGGLVHVCM